MAYTYRMHKARFIIFLCVLAVFSGSAKAEDAFSRQQCLQDWKKMMQGISDAQVEAVCQCIEEEINAHPMDAGKGSQLAGPGGLDNAGPWPNIQKNCVFAAEPKSSVRRKQEAGKEAQ